MASLSTLYSSSPSLKQSTVKAFTSPTTRGDSFSFPHTSKPTTHLPLTLSASRADTSHSDAAAAAKKELIKDPDALWKRYLHWLYQQKDIGLYLDVSRVGFTDEFVVEMEERFKSAFKAMEQLEKGSIANPDEGRMVGHYWLRNSGLAPRPGLKTLIENTLDSICSFADDIVSGKVCYSITPCNAESLLSSLFESCLLACLTDKATIFYCGSFYSDTLCRHWRLSSWTSVCCWGLGSW